LEAIAQLVNLPLLISSLIGFLVLFFVLKKFLWKPVLDIIDERRESIEAAFQEVDDARAEIEKLKLDYEQKLAGISAEAQVKLQEAIERGQQLAAEIRQSAEDSREKMIQRTQDEIGREKDKAMAELRNAAIELSFDISQRVLREDLDQERHDRLVRGFIDEMQHIDPKGFK
jgi:F-type H+-transporting ATPase subunit b